MKCVALLSSLLLLSPLAEADGSLLDSQAIAEFDPSILDGDELGFAVAPIGDFNGDGVEDVVVGSPTDDEAGPNEGAVWLLYLNQDGSLAGYDKILSPNVAFSAFFGTAVASMGDLDGDGTVDLAVGAYNAEDVHIVFLNPDATVKSYVTIEGQFFVFGADPEFGHSVAAADFDGDGRRELIVGSPHLTNDRGLHVFTLDAQATVLAHHFIGDGAGGFTGELQSTTAFGYSVAAIGDVDGDGIPDLAVGDPEDDDGFSRAGAVWVLFMHQGGTVRDQQKISATEGGFAPPLPTSRNFGESLASLGDFDGGGVPDLLVGSTRSLGRIWQLSLLADGTVRSYLSYDGAEVEPEVSAFGRAVASLPDLDGNGSPELVVCAPHYDGAGHHRGAAYVLFPPEVERANRVLYGCNQNPLGSLVPTGPAAVGTTMTFEVDNPLGTQTPGATFPLLVASLTPTGECGVSIDGWHMNPNAQSGELLVLPPFELSILGDAWNGPGQPVTVDLPIPQDPCLMGVLGYVQAAMVDFAGDAEVPIGLTRAWKLRLGT